MLESTTARDSAISPDLRAILPPLAAFFSFLGTQWIDIVVLRVFHILLLQILFGLVVALLSGP